MTNMRTTPPTQSGVRLAEVVAALSLTTDLATGQPLEHGLRRALLAVWLGEALGLDREELSDAYYVALLGTVGCTIEGAAFAGFFPDEIAFGERIVTVDPTRQLGVAAFVLSQVGRGDPPLRRARKVLMLARAGPTATQVVCRDVALQLGDMLDLGPAIREAIGQCHEHWNGKGGPRRLKGEEIRLAARLFILAHDAEIFFRLGGLEAAVDLVRQRTGKLYDPRLADRFRQAAAPLLTRLQAVTAWDAVLDAEPAPVRLLATPEVDCMVEAVAKFVDLRSAYTLGHSPRVASLAEAAGRELGLTEAETAAVRRAGLLHDLGRAGVPVAVWDKVDPLTVAEWERMRRHPSMTELVLARSSALGHLGTVAGLHHERLDGSGYRGVSAVSLPMSARVVAVADAYQSKLEPRPHRRAVTADEAAHAIRVQAKQGQLDTAVVDAMLKAVGHRPPPKRQPWPAGLSDREVEVLRLAIRGLSNRQIADALCISPKTVGHHIQHIYDKIGVSTRVGATLFAVQHDLLQETA